MNKLNTRQWTLYEYLKMKNGAATKVKEILHDLREIPEYNLIAFKDWNNQPAKRLMSKDIQTINKCELIQKVIVSNGDGIRLATREEYKYFLEKEKIAILSKAKRYWQKVKKFEKDNQMRLTFGTKERETIEAFVGEDYEAI